MRSRRHVQGETPAPCCGRTAGARSRRRAVGAWSSGRSPTCEAVVEAMAENSGVATASGSNSTKRDQHVARPHALDRATAVVAAHRREREARHVQDRVGRAECADVVPVGVGGVTSAARRKDRAVHPGRHQHLLIHGPSQNHNLL